MWNLYSQVFFYVLLVFPPVKASSEEGAYRLVPLKQDHTTTLVTSCEVVASLVELDS